MEKKDEPKGTGNAKRITSDAEVIMAIMQHLRVHTAKDFAAMIGVSRQVVSSILNGGAMSSHVRGAILSRTDVNPTWLDTGEGEIMQLSRAVEADYSQLLKKEIELKNEIIRSKDQTIMLLNKMLTERELLLEEKNRTIKLLQGKDYQRSIVSEERPNYKGKPKPDAEPGTPR